MDLDTRKTLREDLTRLATEMAAGMRAAMLVEGPARARAFKLHADERVGDGFDVWTDLLARRGAVLWVLKSVYVRVLEDRRLLVPGRILDAESQGLFEHLAPNLGPTAYLRWVYRDLASPRGGLPELFAPQPAEIVAPSDALSQRLLDLWRGRDLSSGALRYRFDEEHFDGRLMGDLYQDLDPVVKKRYALLQTPDFIIDFILDETLGPAIAEWGVEAVRVLDPACGSGHFLLAAFKRLVGGMREKLPARPVREVVEDVLRRVVGIDLNDYACALARARLVMTALEACGESNLATGAPFHPQVYWADALEQVEREDLGQLGLFKNGRPKALLTRPEVRAALAPILRAGFHVVVGNPPYITEKDASKRDYHKEKVGKGRRYVSAAGKYSLGVPFTERMLQLAMLQGFVGEITADSFMKREFGKALIEQVLARKDLTKIVSTSGAYVPGHGTPTIIVFARNQAPSSDTVRVVMGKRGEPGKPEDPAKGRVWSSIVEGHARAGYENEFVSVADVPRTTMNTHPWSIGGGGAAELKKRVEDISLFRLARIVSAVGPMAVPGEDEVYVFESSAMPSRLLCDADEWVPFVEGEHVRDWATATVCALFPYDWSGVYQAPRGASRHLWRYRTTMASGILKQARNKRWDEYGVVYLDKLEAKQSIAFAFKATNNHFIFDEGNKVFKQTAPVIKLPSNATKEQHLALLAQLNSAVGEFWVKQSCQNCGYSAASGGGRMTAEPFDDFYERDAAKLESFPLIATSHPQLEAFARHLDTLARARVADSPRATLDEHAASGADALRAALDARRDRDLARLYQMVGLQEELDWLCYKLYGIDPEAPDLRDPEHVPPLRPGFRPFEVTLAQDDAERRAALARGEEPDEQPTAWFERHGWEPVTDIWAPNVGSGTPNARWSTPNVESGTPNVESGTPNVESGTPNVESGTPNARWSTPNVESGTPNARWSTPNVGSGTPNARWSTPNVESGTPNARWSTPNVGSGTPNVESGTPNARWSTPNVGSGTPNVGSSTPNVGSGTPNARSTSPDAGSSRIASLSLLEARIARTAASRDLALVEQPTYKRRWYRPDHAKEEREALSQWLDDRLEAWAKERKEPFTVRQAASALRADPAVLAVAELLAARPDFDLDTLAAERIRLQSVPNLKHHLFKPEGLLKRAAWERTWALQHLEDAGKLPLVHDGGRDDGKPVPIPVPPKYDRADYLKPEHWALRGKLDVPKERFIAFTEVPTPAFDAGEEALYGWAGWTHRERARALLALDEKAESAGVKVPDRYGLLYGVWSLLPYVAWESPQAASDFRADVKSLVGEQGVTEEMLGEWAGRFPLGRGKAARGRRRAQDDPGAVGKRHSPGGSRRVHTAPRTLMEPDEAATTANGDDKPAPRGTPSRQRDPRWLAVVLEELLRICPATSDQLAAAVRARAELDPGSGMRLMGGVDRRGEWRQVGHLQRELEHLGWIEPRGEKWILTASGDMLARGRPTEAPFRFARTLCLAGERAYGGVVGRLLARLWELSPERQGAVILPSPSLDEPPADTDEIEPWLRKALGKQRDLMISLTPGLKLPDAATEPPASDVADGRWSSWDKLPPHRRRARMREIVEERTLGWLFGAIAPPAEVKVWQTRMDWAGLSLLARRLPGVAGQVWFPVGAFRAQGGADFTAVDGLAHDGRAYHCHTPSGPAAEARFAASLFDAYDARSRAERAEYVSLDEIRDAVCYDLRISHETFQELLGALVPRVVRGEVPYQLSLEVDITPEERARLGSSLTVVVNHIPRHIIAMRRVSSKNGGPT